MYRDFLQPAKNMTTLYFLLFLLNLLIDYAAYQYCGLFDMQRVRNKQHNPTVKRINSSLEHGPVLLWVTVSLLTTL